MKLVLDAGALIGVDRDDRRVAGLIELARRSGGGLATVAPVVGQAWRNGSGQARLARALRMVAVVETTEQAARRAGELLARTGGDDVVDALLALLAAAGDQVLTGDPHDLGELVRATGAAATIVRV
ncbi:MAG: hypothetical protein ACT4QF_14170 [Sporichthyaceae bacterium]